jgi:hypothetical protein
VRLTLTYLIRKFHVKATDASRAAIIPAKSSAGAALPPARGLFHRRGAFFLCTCLFSFLFFGGSTGCDGIHPDHWPRRSPLGPLRGSGVCAGRSEFKFIDEYGTSFASMSANVSMAYAVPGCICLVIPCSLRPPGFWPCICVHHEAV